MIIWDCLRQEINEKMISYLFGIASQEMLAFIEDKSFKNLFKISQKSISFLIDFKIDF